MLDNSVKYIYDEPVTYKSLKIYPVKMRDLFEFNYAVECLLMDKDSVPDVQVISMTYYDFLLYVGNQTEDGLNNPIRKLDILFRLCLGLDRDLKTSPIEYGADGKKSAFKIDNVIYYSDDFEKIKDIIIKQNDIDTFDPNIKKETRDMLDKALEMKSKMHGDKQCGIEDQMICLSLASGISLEDIYNLSIRKFKKYIKRADYKIHYEIYKMAAMIGFVEFKDKNFPKHWMVDLDSGDKYSDVLVSFDSVSDKISNKTK